MRNACNEVRACDVEWVEEDAAELPDVLLPRAGGETVLDSSCEGAERYVRRWLREGKIVIDIDGRSFLLCEESLRDKVVWRRENPDTRYLRDPAI